MLTFAFVVRYSCDTQNIYNLWFIRVILLAGNFARFFVYGGGTSGQGGIGLTDCLR